MLIVDACGAQFRKHPGNKTLLFTDNFAAFNHEGYNVKNADCALSLGTADAK